MSMQASRLYMNPVAEGGSVRLKVLDTMPVLSLKWYTMPTPNKGTEYLASIQALYGRVAGQGLFQGYLGALNASSGDGRDQGCNLAYFPFFFLS